MFAPIAPAYTLPFTPTNDEDLPLAIDSDIPWVREALRDEDLDTNEIARLAAKRAAGHGTWLTAMPARFSQPSIVFVA
jgi:hypothetical protein